MKHNKLIYETPVLKICLTEMEDVVTFSQGNPTQENIGKDDWDGKW